MPYLPKPGSRIYAVIAGTIALFLSQAALPSQGFIAGSYIDADDQSARMSVQFRCGVEVLGHEPANRGDRLRIRLDSTGICSGTTPRIAFTREQHRPIGADDARLVSMEYDGDSPAGHVLRLDFSQEVQFDVVRSLNDSTITIEITLEPGTRRAERPKTGSTGRLVRRAEPSVPKFVINLESSLRPPAAADLPRIKLDRKNKVFVTEAVIDGKRWYRTRVGYFATADEAARVLRQLRAQYPTAWIDRENENAVPLPVATAPQEVGDVPVEPGGQAPPPIAGTRSGQLMQDARRAMINGELSRAIQIYTKVLQLPETEYHQDAQEYLALARERNGQLAHARAEYRRYLSVYPDGEGAERVQQRLATMTAVASTPAVSTGNGQDASTRQKRQASGWKVRTFASQFYRRDVNQMNEEEQIISQSSIYSDLSVDARRRGERFDFSARVTGGHRHDLLGEERVDDKDFRLSYAYADLADSKTRLRGRLGRQTRNSGGVLGRFDGFNLSYGLTERVQLEAVVGKPVYSTTDGVDGERSFYGLSTNFGPIRENLDLRVFLLQQDIEGMTDRQSIGGELRYFGQTKSLWGMFDYDTGFSELSSAFLQGSWRLPSKLTITGLIDHRQSPYLSLGNALIGQVTEDFSTLQTLYTEDELLQLALDRSAATTTVTLGLSKALTPKLQLGINATHSIIDGTQESGGVLATPETEYSYYSMDLVASSLFTERDVSIFGLRYSQSDTNNVYTVNVDTRFRIGKSWRIAPRLRVDYREIITDTSEQWTYTPGLRLEYRRGRKLRIELMAGKQFSVREMTDTDLDRESYYVNVGYQLFF